MHLYILTRALFAIVTVWVVFGVLALAQKASQRRQVALAIPMLLCLAGALRLIVHTLVTKLKHPPNWDVGIYWLWGRVAVISHKVYDPASNVAIGLTVARDAIWRQEVIARGFLYPPTTILVFAPLGLFRTFHSAAPWWYAVNVAALAIAIALLWRIYFEKAGILGLLATAVLVFAFPATAQTLFTGQPMTIMLLLLTLYVVDRTRLRGGLWLGVAFVVKPLALVLFLVPLCTRRFAQAGVAAATVAGAAVLTVLLLGWQNVLTYFTNGPDRRYAGAVFLDPGDYRESIFPALVRLSHQTAPHSFLQDPLFLFCASAMTLVTVVLCAMVKGPDRNALGLSLFIPLALLVYPPSSFHYNDMLLIPIFTLWKRFESTRPGAAALFISALYAFQVNSTALNVLSPLSLWLVFAAIAIAMLRAPRTFVLRPA